MSFYLRGISFIDLAHLRKSDLKGRLFYYTEKKDRTVPHHPMGEGDAGVVGKVSRRRPPPSSYLFPFLVDDGNKRQDKTIDKKQDEARLYHNAEARISYHLRKFGATIGIKGKLTLYVARPFLGNDGKR